MSVRLWLVKFSRNVTANCSQSIFTAPDHEHYYQSGHISVGFTSRKTKVSGNLKLENVVFTGYSVHGNSSGEPLPSEQVSCNFTKITYTYTEFDNKTGSKKGNVESAYEMGANKA